MGASIAMADVFSGAAEFAGQICAWLGSALEPAVCEDAIASSRFGWLLLRMDFGETALLGQFIQKHCSDALEFPAFAEDEPAEHRQREQDEPWPEPLKTSQADENQFQTEHRPENDFCLQ